MDEALIATKRNYLHADIEVRFTYHPPTENQIDRYEMIREQAKAFAHIIVGHTRPSREQSLALTKLEEAVMHANAAIARREGADAQ